MRKVTLLMAAVMLLVVGITAPVLASHLGPTARINETFDDGGKFVGELREIRVVDPEGTPKIAGRLVGEYTSPSGDVTQVNENIRARLVDLNNGGQAGTCDILFLDLGPLHLDVLGLVIDLDRVRLNITGETGPGNLLGNLLCAVAGLLDP